jgi:biotin synthase
MIRGAHLSVADRLAWLREEDPARLAELYAAADRVRRETVGDAVHLRGLIEVSNYCVRECGYCGLRATHRELERYRLTRDEVRECAGLAVDLGYGTVVLQAGEDYGITRDWLAEIVRTIKRETPLAVTLSMGERPDEDLIAWRAAGADRYLIRFETSDPELYARIHPAFRGRPSDREAILKTLKRLGYEAGSGVMIGLPGQTFASLASDIELFQRLDLDMIGVGPYIPHPSTPLGQGLWRRAVDPAEQVPNTEEMVYKVVALTRLACPSANIPSTTALATINLANGRELGLERGANVVMPNVTPVAYRRLYEIYPSKACIFETASACYSCLHQRIASIGRTVGSGPGGRAQAVALPSCP